MVIRLKAKIDDARVREAIELAEQRSSGEIVVSIADYYFGDLHRAAHRTFERLGIANTRQRNGVLLFIEPARRQFQILADSGIDGRVSPAFWAEVAEQLSRRFQEGDFTGGLVEAIERIGAELAAHFPRQPDDLDELANEPHRIDHPR